MRTSKEEFKEFERQDVKYREDLKHMKQKLKKLEDKLEKVFESRDFLKLSSCIHLTVIIFQDSLKIEDMTKDCENSRNLIPKLEDNIPKLQKLLADDEKVLEEMKENSKGIMASLDSY